MFTMLLYNTYLIRIDGRYVSGNVLVKNPRFAYNFPSAAAALKYATYSLSDDFVVVRKQVYAEMLPMAGGLNTLPPRQVKPTAGSLGR